MYLFAEFRITLNKDLKGSYGLLCFSLSLFYALVISLSCSLKIPIILLSQIICLKKSMNLISYKIFLEVRV